MMRNIGPPPGRPDRRIIVLIPLPRVASQNHSESLVEPLRPRTAYGRTSYSTLKYLGTRTEYQFSLYAAIVLRTWS